MKTNTFSVVPPQAIWNSPLNTSTAKRVNKFSKQKRFRVPPPNCPLVAYDLPSQQSNRKSAFGFGTKYDFTKSSVLSPSCNTYETIQWFKNQKGKSFGVSRELSAQFGIITQDILKFPGPGKYQAKKDTLSNISFTMRPKTVDFIEKKKTNRYGPGPGNYQHLEAFPKDGKAFFQRFQSSKFAKIHNDARFKSVKDSPSPHTYDIKNNLSKQGKYLLSKNKGHGTRAFSHTARIGFTENSAKLSISPGPGVYERTSDFGIYGNSQYYKDMNSGSKLNKTIPVGQNIGSKTDRTIS